MRHHGLRGAIRQDRRGVGIILVVVLVVLFAGCLVTAARQAHASRVTNATQSVLAGALALQAAILAGRGIPFENPLVASVLASVAGLAGAKAWYGVLHPDGVARPLTAPSPVASSQTCQASQTSA